MIDWWLTPTLAIFQLYSGGNKFYYTLDTYNLGWNEWPVVYLFSGKDDFNIVKTCVTMPFVMSYLPSICNFSQINQTFLFQAQKLVPMRLGLDKFHCMFKLSLSLPSLVLKIWWKMWFPSLKKEWSILFLFIMHTSSAN